MTWSNEESGSGPTQLDAIRDLTLAATARGEWLTLAEIAGLTEYGEASISAQLRHLRKRRHGKYRVEKRRRRLLLDEATCAAASQCARADAGATASGEAPALEPLWEYGVYAPREFEHALGTGVGDAAEEVRHR